MWTLNYIRPFFAILIWEQFCLNHLYMVSIILGLFILHFISVVFFLVKYWLRKPEQINTGSHTMLLVHCSDSKSRINNGGVWFNRFTVPYSSHKKIKDTSSSDFHSENSTKKGNKSVIFQCPHIFNNAFSYISPHLSGTSVASGGFCKNILKRISNACPMVLITSYASPPPQSTTKQAVEKIKKKIERKRLTDSHQDEESWARKHYTR